MNYLFKIPFTVESFEPHSEYMIDNRVWKKGGLKHLVYTFGERLIKNRSFRLYPVSTAYKDSLVKDGVARDKIEVLPCTVEEASCSFSTEARYKIRRDLRIPSDSRVGIYVGKFGGLYLESEEVVRALETLHARKPFSHLILLSDPQSATCQLLRRRLEFCSLHIDLVPPQAVGLYLSAADFGLILTRPTKSSNYLSPIKTGEYLISGLEVVTTPSIGNESEIIGQQGLGLVFSDSLTSFQDFDCPIGSREEIRHHGIRLRGRHRSHSAYDRLLRNIAQVDKLS